MANRELIIMIPFLVILKYVRLEDDT